MPPILTIEGLKTVIPTRSGDVVAVNGVDLVVERGKTLGIVGESGCGKSILSLSVMGLLPPPGETVAGRIMFEGTDLLALSASQMRKLRGGRIAMIFQEPMTSLNPTYTVGWQIAESMRIHEPNSDALEIRQRVVDGLAQVRIADPARCFDRYPYQLSGGMRQRVMIAMALACKPDVLIADEPTTALDVTVQAQILALLRELQAETGMAIILITHDLGVIAEMADDVAVMYAGRIVERASAVDLFDDPQHPYTLGLLGSMPSLYGVSERLPAIGGMVPSPFAVPPGCNFHPRCPFNVAECREQAPPLRDLGHSHVAACIRTPVELAVGTQAQGGQI